MLGEMAIIAGVPRLTGATALEATTGLTLDARAVQGLIAAPRPAMRELGRRLGREAVGLLRELIARLEAAVDQDPRAAQAPPSGGGPPPPVVEVDPEPGGTAYLESAAVPRRVLRRRARAAVRRPAPPVGAAGRDARGGGRAAERAADRGAGGGRVDSPPRRCRQPRAALGARAHRHPYRRARRRRAVAGGVPRRRAIAGPRGHPRAPGELDAADDLAARRLFRGIYRDTVDAIVQSRPAAGADGGGAAVS